MSLPDHLYTPRARAMTELQAVGSLARLPFVWARQRLPRGSCRVLVLPGYLTNDLATWPLRRTLSRVGHDVHGWGLGRNHGRVRELVDGVTRRVEELATDRPIHLIGWSLGGYVAREVARENPDSIAQVITLASPVVGGPKYTASAPHYRDELGIDLDELEASVARRNERPIEVPITALFTRRDTIVCPAACIDRFHDHVEHIEIDTTHMGIGLHPRTFEIIAERLSKRR